MSKLFTAVIVTTGLLFCLTSCEKVINVDLNESASRVVIEGNITDGPGPYNVLLSRSVSFTHDNNMPPITDALVVIKDSTAGITDTLTEITPGRYQTHFISGIIGHTYQLSVFADNTWFNASNTIQPLVPFDSLYLETISFFGIEVKEFVPVYKDPVGVPNYYRFTVQVNDSLQDNIYTWDDRFTDGKINSRPIDIYNEDLFTHNDDTVIVEMRCIDKAAYDYFRTVGNAQGGAATPANPLSNLSGNALGYFAAYTVRRKIMTTL